MHSGKQRKYASLFGRPLSLLLQLYLQRLLGCLLTLSLWDLRLKKRERWNQHIPLCPFTLRTRRNTRTHFLRSHGHTKHHAQLKPRFRNLASGQTNFLLKYTQSRKNIHRQTHARTHVCLHVEAEEGELCSVFEHEWADVVVALHAWVRLYSTWLQYPAGLEMGSNTLTQLSDQTNWVWEYVYACVCRGTLVYVCLNACVTLSWTI